MHFSTVVFRTVWPNWQQSRLLRLALSSFSKLATFLYFKCYFSAFIAGTNVTYDKKKAFPKVGEEGSGFGLRSLSRASFENIQSVQPDRPREERVPLIQLRLKANICPQEEGVDTWDDRWTVTQRLSRRIFTETCLHHNLLDRAQILPSCFSPPTVWIWDVFDIFIYWNTVWNKTEINHSHTVCVFLAAWSS